MARFFQINAPLGLDDAFAVLQFLSDPEMAKDRAEYLQQVLDAYAIVNERVEQVAKADEIEDLHRQAVADRAAARKAVEDAAVQVNAMTAEAEAKAGAIRDELQGAQDRLDAAQAAHRAQMATDLTALEARTASVERREEAAAAALASAATREAEADAMKAELEQKLTAFKALAG